MANKPPSPEVQLDDWLDLTPINERIQIFKLMDTVGGAPLCFVYSGE
jgi:hypothetical protein